MSKYKTLHLWMIIPMLFMQFGIYRDYWGDFTDNAWSVHIHYWTGTVWYAFLIIQLYYATHSGMARHRTNGIIGMFLAGSVCLTAIKSMLNRKEIENHAWSLISTVFIIRMPALGRRIQNMYVGMHIKEWPRVDIMQPIYLTQVLIIAMLLCLEIR